MVNVILALVLVLIVGAVSLYLLSARKKGKKCIGCPHGDGCGGLCGGDCARKKQK